eukprot:7377180-Prymnesium_polylepis.1
MGGCYCWRTEELKQQRRERAMGVQNGTCTAADACRREGGGRALCFVHEAARVCAWLSVALTVCVVWRDAIWRGPPFPTPQDVASWQGGSTLIAARRDGEPSLNRHELTWPEVCENPGCARILPDSCPTYRPFPIMYSQSLALRTHTATRGGGGGGARRGMHDGAATARFRRMLMDGD